MVGAELAATVCDFVVLPAQASVTVLEPPPPLKARMLMSRRGCKNVKVSDVTPGLANEMLGVVNCPYGPDTYHVVVPQLMTPLGYWPTRLVPPGPRSSNVTVSGPLGSTTSTGTPAP